MELMDVGISASNKQNANTSDEQVLPNDVIIDIIESLPVKTLLSFKCVSKFWCNLIESPCFVKKHLLKQQQSDSTIVLLLNNLLDNGVFSFHDPKSPRLEEICPKLSVQLLEDSECRLLGPCDGLVCIAYGKYDVILCNPALGQCKKLPSCLYFDRYISRVGQGFGKTCTGDYKVVFACVFRNYGDHVLSIYVYNLSTESWTNPFCCNNNVVLSDYPNSHIVFNGACHWNAKLLYANDTPLILSFNLSTESLVHFQYPHWLPDRDHTDSGPYLMVINECLAFVQCSPEKVVEVWIMKEYGVKESWMKYYIRHPYCPSRSCDWLYDRWSSYKIRPLVTFENDEWLLGQKESGGLVSFSFSKQETKSFPIKGVWNRLHAVNYKESLIRLEGIMKSVPLNKLDGIVTRDQ